MKLLLDACSCILLAKAGILSEIAAAHELSMSEGALSEVLAGRSKGLSDALLAERLREEGRVSTAAPASAELVSRIAADFGMGAGEAETLALFLEGRGRSGAVATDNRQARRAASVHGIPVVGSPELVVSLFRGSRISKERARAALAALKRFGWFADALIDVAMEELEGR